MVHTNLRSLELLKSKTINKAEKMLRKTYFFSHNLVVVVRPM